MFLEINSIHSILVKPANGPAFVLPGDSPECREKTGTGLHETLVKDLSDLRPDRLNHFDTHYLPPAQP
jgi:hypothetical protein